jgi:hypothetical protein
VKLKTKIMTTEEIKKHFEGVKTVKCLKDGRYYPYEKKTVRLAKIPEKFICGEFETLAYIWSELEGFAKIINYHKEPLVETTIQAVITVETDGDFSLRCDNPERCDYVAKFDGNYEFELTLEESTAVDVLKEFLKSCKIRSSKDWHKKHLEDGIDLYLKQLDTHLCSSEDLLGGGNWSFIVSITKISKTYL